MKLNGINLYNNFSISKTQPSFKGNEAVSQSQTDTSTVTPPIKAQSSEAIKSQIGIKTPISYNFLGDFEIKNAGTAKLYKLANGQKVVILNKKGPTVLKSYFNVGSMNEPDRLRGVSHFDEHMAFNGTDNLEAGEFFKITNKMGAITNASTGFSLTDYYITSQLLNPTDFEESVRIQSEMLQHPKYSHSMVEKEKGPVTSEISMVGDSPENTALNNCIKNLFQIKTKSPDLVAGTISNIQNITRDDAFDYYNTWYTPDNCVTVVTGEVDPESTMALISKYFNSTKTSKPENKKYEEFNPITKSVRKDVKMRKAQGTTVSLGFSGPQNSSAKEYIELELILMSLLGYKGARISKALDKIQTSASFSVERMGNRPQDPKAILLVGQATPDKSEKMIKILYSQISQLASKPISEEELNTAKNMMKLGYSLLSENSQLLNNFIGTAMVDNDLNYAKDYMKIVDSITTQDLSNFAKKYLDLNKASLSVVHPQNTDKKSMMANYMNANNLAKNIAFKGRIEDKTFDTSKIKQYRLANKMEVAFNPNKSDIVSYRIKLDTKIPASAPPSIPILLAVMLNEGSKNKNYTQMYNEANKKGMEIKMKAEFDSITANVNALSEDTAESLDLVQEVINQPRLTENSLKYAKSFIKEILLNTPSSAAAPLVKELFPESAEFATKEETLQSLETATLEDVRKFYEYVMKNAQATAVFTAPTEKNPGLVKTVNEKLTNSFNEFKPVRIEHFESYKPITHHKIITKADPRNQADIVQAYKFKTNFNPKDHIAIALMNTILGDGPYSRLFNDLRETQKLAYRVESSVDYHGNTGVLTLGIKTTTDNKSEDVKQYENVNKSIDGFKKHIEKMKNERVTDEELDSAKLRLKTKILNSIESSNGQTGVLSSSKDSVYGLDATAKSLELIDQITVDDIYSTANYIFNSNSVISVLASQDTLDNINLPAADVYKSTRK